MKHNACDYFGTVVYESTAFTEGVKYWIREL